MCCWWKTIRERGTGLSQYPNPAYGSRVLPRCLEPWGWGWKCKVTSLYIVLPWMSQKLDLVMLEVPISPLHVSGMDPRHPCKVPTHIRTPNFSGWGEEVPFVFGAWQMPKALIQNLWLTLNSSGKWSSESGQNRNTHSLSAFPYVGGRSEKAKSKGPQEAAWMTDFTEMLLKYPCT